MKLTESEIRQRLIRLRNLEHLHASARERIVFLEMENRQLKQRVKELEESDRDKNQKIEALSFQFEQIKNKLFGKKPIARSILRIREKKTRDIFSYHRPVPESVTGTEPHPVNECAHCHGELQKKSISIFFVEDIPLPIVLCPMSYVLCHMSYVLCPMSYVLCPMSYVLCPMSYVLCPMSYVLCPMSYVLCPMSYVLCPM